MRLPTEPILRAEDLRCWDTLRREALVHARSRRHAQRLDVARRIACDALDTGATWVVSWSGGKDSTALTHLVCCDRGAKVPVISEKDDLDYPDEETYVQRLCAAWHLDLQIVRPPSLSTRLAAMDLLAWDDLHSRSSELSRVGFYGPIEEACAGYDGIFLGLRAAESWGRRMNAAMRGPSYRKRSGQLVCSPLSWWSGLDVFAYLLIREIPVLDLYRCLAFMHAREPWQIRKSWWIGGRANARGHAAWLRHYWPSLHHRLLDLLPRIGELS